MRRFFQTIFLSSILVISGCTFKPLSQHEMATADLMPVSVAKQFLKKYNLGEFNYLHEGGAIGCGSGTIVVPSSELTQIVYFKSTQTVILRKRNYLCFSQGAVNNVATESDAREIAKALRALGASKLDEIKVMGYE